MAKISKSPRFCSQKLPTNTATILWRFLLRFWSLLVQFLCLFLLVSHHFLPCRDILEPQNSPPNEVTGFFFQICSCFFFSFLARRNWTLSLKLGARLIGRTATQRSKKGSEKVLGRFLGKGSQKGSEKGACYGLYSKQGF